MKRLLVALLLVAMMMSTGLAEVVDLASMTTDELIELRQQIASEIKKRITDSFDGNEIPTGVFVAGKDIKAGNYTLQMSSESSGNVIILDSYETYLAIMKSKNTDDRTGILLERYVRREDKLYFTIEEGQVLLFEGKGRFVDEQPSWKP